MRKKGKTFYVRLRRGISLLLEQLFEGESMPEFTIEGLYKTINQDNVHLFTEHRDGKLVGMALLYTVQTMSRNLGVVEEVVVDEKYRGKGIATKIMNKIIKKAKELELDCLELTVKNRNTPAMNLYKNIGFYDRKQHAMRLWFNK